MSPNKFQLLFIVFLSVILWIPISVEQIDSLPKNESKYIRRVFEDHTVGQSFNTRFSSHSIKIKVRGEGEYPGRIMIEDEKGIQLVDQIVNLTEKDTWVSLPFSSILKSGAHTLTIKTLPETPREEVILVRYEPRSDSYPNGQMIYDGEGSYGDIGFKIISDVPYWKTFIMGAKVDSRNYGSPLIRISLGLIIGLVLWGMVLYGKTTKRKKIFYSLILIALFLVSMLLRAPYPYQLEGVFGGDAFNYLTKTQAILQGNDPFTADARKGPLYSFLLLPSFLSDNPLLWSRWLGITSASLAVVALTLFSIASSLPLGLALGSGLLLAVNQQFIWESPNGMANTLYVLTIMASLLAFLKASRPKYQWLLAILLGLVFLTRFEGGTYAVILLPALWWREKYSWRRAFLLGLVTFSIMMIPQLSLVWSGDSGIRGANDILADDGLFLIKSGEDLVNNLGRFNRFLESVWFTLKATTTKSTTSSLLVGVIVGILLKLTKKRWSAHYVKLMQIVSISLIILTSTLVFSESLATDPTIYSIIYIAVGAGIASWIIVMPYNSLVILLATGVQTAVLIAILPKSRYFLPLVPMLVFALTYGVRTLFRWDKSKYAQLAPTLFIGLLVVFIHADNKSSHYDLVVHHNKKAAPTIPMIEAVTYLRAQREVVGFRSGYEQVAFIYLPEERRYEFSLKSSDPVKIMATEYDFLTKANIKYIVERHSSEATWHLAHKYPEIFQLHKTFITEYSEDGVDIYSVNQELLQSLDLKQF